MRYEIAVVVAVAFVGSILLTARMRAIALSRQILDIPNERSSHDTPTPRGGGVAIVLATILVLLFLAWRGAVALDLFAALAGGGLLVAAVGFVDDHKQLAARVRLAVHLAAAIWAIIWLGGVPPLQVAADPVSLGAAGFVVGVLAIVWTLNLFNFMDGIDGIAASEAVFVCWGGAVLASAAGPFGDAAVASVVVGAASLGFLVWNWPPARIFMGDVGSGFLGFVIAVLAIGAGRDAPAAPFAWLILGGVFFADTGVTLVRRIARSERVYVAHRTHAYQLLARRWSSHRRVTLAVTAINVLWLLPCALFAALYPALALWTLLVALTPLMIAAVASGAGQPESRKDG